MEVTLLAPVDRRETRLAHEYRAVRAQLADGVCCAEFERGPQMMAQLRVEGAAIVTVAAETVDDLLLCGVQARHHLVLVHLLPATRHHGRVDTRVSTALSLGVGMLSEMEATSLRFAYAARTIADVTRAQGLLAPAFRSPPASAGLQRSLRRRGGGVIVAVRLRQRPWVAVLADMIDGVIAANRLEGVAAHSLRTSLWQAVEGAVVVAA